MRRLLAHSLALLLATAAIAEANDVLVSIKNGKLSVKGDADANQLTIDGTGLQADSLRITPHGGTTVNGLAGAQTFTGFVGGVTIKLGDGDDELGVFQKTLAGKVAINLGAGSDALEIIDATLEGPNKIDLGGGDDAFAVCDSRVESDLTLKIGKGTEGPVVASCGGSLNLAASVDASAFAASDSTFEGALTVKAASGRHAAVIDDTDIAGELTTKNVAYLGLCYSTYASGVKATMPKVLVDTGQARCDSNGIGDAELDVNAGTAVVIASSLIGGPVIVKGNAGFDAVSMAQVNVLGNLAVSLGSGRGEFTLVSATIAGDLVVKSGKGDDAISGTDLLVNGETTLKAGDGTNNLYFIVTQFDGDVLVKTGKGDDTLNFGTLVEFGAGSTIDPGKGTNTVTVP